MLPPHYPQYNVSMLDFAVDTGQEVNYFSFFSRVGDSGLCFQSDIKELEVSTPF